MAQNAVSLTRQNPEALLPERTLNYHIINRHLNYYLGTSTIHGEDYPLISDCTVRVEENKIRLSLMAHPEIDTNDFTAWAILKSSPSSIDQETKIVDFYPDPNNSLRYIPDKEISYDFPYCNALFIVEGRISDQTRKAEWKTEWEEIPIAAPKPVIKEDEYEPDDDPNAILFDPKHEVHINDMPRTRNFYCGDPEACYDIDWVWFYAEAGKIYGIYAQDLSEYGYFIQIRLYDFHMMLHYNPNSRQYSIANNYLAFYCRESGYYLLSIHPQGGEEYILTICNLEASDGFADLVLQIEDPLRRDLCVKGEIKDNEGNVKYIYYPQIHNFIFSESLHSWKFDGLSARDTIILNIYEGNDCNGLPTGSITVDSTFPRCLNEVIIDPKKLSKLIGNNIHFTPNKGKKTKYRQEIEKILSELDPNKSFPFGDLDPNFLPEGDYDGDGICNSDEVMVYSNRPDYSTIPLPLLKGLNLFYFPSIGTKRNIASEKAMNIINQICYYEPSTKAWEEAPLNFLVFNAFNAIDASAPGLLYLDLNEEPTIPVLWLKGFLDPGDSCEGSHPSCCLNTDFFDPNCFKANASISEILNNPNLPEIEEIISGQGFLDGKWESSYPFFGRLMGQDKRIDPYGVYIIKNSVYH